MVLSANVHTPVKIGMCNPALRSVRRKNGTVRRTLGSMPSIVPSSIFCSQTMNTPCLRVGLGHRSVTHCNITINSLRRILDTTINNVTLAHAMRKHRHFPVQLHCTHRLHSDPRTLSVLLMPATAKVRMPLGRLTSVRCSHNTRVVRDRGAFLMNCIVFSGLSNHTRISIIGRTDGLLRTGMGDNRLILPGNISCGFTNGCRRRRHTASQLVVIIPLTLLVILLMLCFRFHAIATSLVRFSNMFMTFTNNFVLL